MGLVAMTGRAREASASGTVYFRDVGGGGAGGKAATVMFDGHCTKFTFDQLNDMRRWSNQATDADWTLGSR